MSIFYKNRIFVQNSKSLKQANVVSHLSLTAATFENNRGIPFHLKSLQKVNSRNMPSVESIHQKKSLKEFDLPTFILRHASHA